MLEAIWGHTLAHLFPGMAESKPRDSCARGRRECKNYGQLRGVAAGPGAPGSPLFSVKEEEEPHCGGGVGVRSSRRKQEKLSSAQERNSPPELWLLDPAEK